MTAAEERQHELLELRAVVALTHGLPGRRPHGVEDARLLRLLRLNPGGVGTALRCGDDLLDGGAERVDRPHPREVAHRRAQTRIDVFVVGVDHCELATRRADRRDLNDVRVVHADLRLGVGRRVGVRPRDARDHPAPLLGQVRDHHHVAGFQAVGLGVEEAAVAPRGGLLGGQLLAGVDLRAQQVEVLRRQPPPALAEAALLELAEHEARAALVRADDDVAAHVPIIPVPVSAAGLEKSRFIMSLNFTQ